MGQFIYRLQLLLEQKEDARKDAEREVVRQEKELETQVAALQILQKQLDELTKKRLQLRRELTQPGQSGVLSSEEAQRRFENTQMVGVLIDEAKNDVLSQASLVEQCEAKVKQAKKQLKDATRECEVLKRHREKQEQRFQKEAQVKEDLMLDEVGNVLYTTRRRQL